MSLTDSAHLDPASQEVDSLDLQRAYLTGAQAGIGSEPDERSVRRCDGFGECLDLLGAEEQHIGLRRSRKAQAGVRVRLDSAGVHGDGQHVASDLHGDSDDVCAGAPVGQVAGKSLHGWLVECSNRGLARAGRDMAVEHDLVVQTRLGLQSPKGPRAGYPREVAFGCGGWRGGPVAVLLADVSLPRRAPAAAIGGGDGRRARAGWPGQGGRGGGGQPKHGDRRCQGAGRGANPAGPGPPAGGRTQAQDRPRSRAVGPCATRWWSRRAGATP